MNVVLRLNLIMICILISLQMGISHNIFVYGSNKICLKVGGTEIEWCMYIFSVNGSWSAWSLWNGCTTTCGGGRNTRNRTCTNPSPQYGGEHCKGSTTDDVLCGMLLCPSMYIYVFQMSKHTIIILRWIYEYSPILYKL